MNILDENIVESQRQLLLSWRIRVRQVGEEVWSEGIKDDNIISSLHGMSQVTFFTRDMGFYARSLCHASYCLVCLIVGQHEVASFIRRFLRHPAFDTKAKRMGNVVKVGHTGMRVWWLNAEKEKFLNWQ